MYQEKIFLQKAMEQSNKHLLCSWIAHGNHLNPKDIPLGSEVKSTFVAKTPNQDYDLGIIFTTEEGLSVNVESISKFPSLEELKNSYPNLFELEGELHTLP